MVAANLHQPHDNYGSSSDGEDEMKKGGIMHNNNNNNNDYTQQQQQHESPTNNIMLTSSITTEKLNGNNCDERRFVWFQKEEEQKLRAEATTKKEYEYTTNHNTSYHTLPASSKLDSKDFKDKVRAGAGAKGRTGSTDFTRGKNAFVRPCTVGWKSQNQPLMRGGGPRTPRQKG